jgi:hypothetical protein
MAIQEHWKVQYVNPNSPAETAKWYMTALDAKAQAQLLAAANPGKSYVVYRATKEYLAPPQAVQELDPIVTP